MATAITPITAPQNPDITGREVIVDGTVALTGNYVADGDTLNLQQFGGLAKSSQLPTKVEIWEQPTAGTAPTGYNFLFGIGTTQLNGVLIVLQGGADASSPQEQFPAGAYGSPLTGASIRVRAWFPSY